MWFIERDRALAQVTVEICELKSRLSSYVHQAKSGTPVVITDRGEPVVRLMPMGRSLEERMADLIDARLLGWSGKRLAGMAPVAHAQGQQSVANLLGSVAGRLEISFDRIAQ